MQLTVDLSFASRRRVASAPAGMAANFSAANSDGFRATYTSPPTFAPDVTPEYFTVTRQGYVGNVATPISEDLIVTKRTRLPYPNHATLTTDQVSLSDYLYSTDSVLGAANNSALVSPKPIANWALRERTVIGNTLVAEVVAAHRNGRAGEEVAAVEFSVSDGTTTLTQVVTSSVVSAQPGDMFAVIVYRCSIDVSSLINPATLTLNAKVYPHIGGPASVLDSAAQSARREFSPRYYRRDTTLFANPVLVYVSTTGNDTTGVVSTNAATASATPCATIGGALNRLHVVNGRLDGAVVRLMAGTHTLNSTGVTVTRTQDYAELTITRDPTALQSAVILQYGSVAFRPRLGAAGGYLRITDVTFNRTGTTQMTGESVSQLHVNFDSMPFNNGSVAAAITGSADWAFDNLVMTNVTSSALGASARELRRMRGCDVAVTPGGCDGWLVLGCFFRNGCTLAYGARTPTGSFVGFSRFNNPDPSNGAYSLGVACLGAACIQNIFEWWSATGGPSMRVSADNAVNSTEHTVQHHNTYAGFYLNGRHNSFYDDGATPRTNILQSLVGNLNVALNTKGDVFQLDGARLGNWGYLYGVGCRGEYSQFTDANNGGLGTSFAQNYPGPRAKIGTSSTIRQDPLFVSPAATTSGPTAGAGNGNYALQSGSPAKAMVPNTPLKYDITGALRNLAFSSAGAYE